MLFSRFLQDERATHLLFVDSDIAFDAADVMRMLDFDHDIMAAIYSQKYINWDRVADAARKYPDLPSRLLPSVAGVYGTFHPLPGGGHVSLDEPFQIASAGMGLMLIRRDVFIQMIDAYPELMVRLSSGEANFFQSNPCMPGIFNEMVSPDGFFLGEDLSFCERWRAIGGKVHGCGWFKIRHLGTHEYASDLRQIGQLDLTVL